MWLVFFGICNAILPINLFAFSFLWIVPVGAFVAGCLAGGLFYLLAKGFHWRPRGSAFLNALAIAIFAYVLVDATSFVLKAAGAGFSFWDYADPSLREIAFRSNRSVPVGFFFGWLFTITEVIAFALALFGVVGILEDEPFCEKCNKYLKESFKQVRYSLRGNGFDSLLDQYLGMISSQRYIDAIRFHAGEMGEEDFVDDGSSDVKSELDARRCPGCSIHNLSMSVYDIKVKEEEEGGKVKRKVDWDKCNDQSSKAWVDSAFDLSEFLPSD